MATEVIVIPSEGGGGLTIGTTVITGATQGSVLFVGVGGVVQEDNSKFFWDDTNNFLGIGTAAPDAKLHVYGAAADDILLQLDNSLSNYTGTNPFYGLYASGLKVSTSASSDSVEATGMNFSVINGHDMSGSVFGPIHRVTGQYFEARSTASHSVTSTGGGFTETITAVECFSRQNTNVIGNPVTISSNTCDTTSVGYYPHVTKNPTFNNASGTYTSTAYGAQIEVTHQPTNTSSSSLTVTSYGSSVYVIGSSAGTSTAYGYYIQEVSGADTNWGFYNGTSVASAHLGKQSFGTVTAATAQVDIVSPAAATKGLIIKGAASQSANLFETQTSASALLTRIDQNGSLTVRVPAGTTDLLTLVDNATTRFRFFANGAFTFTNNFDFSALSSYPGGCVFSNSLIGFLDSSTANLLFRANDDQIYFRKHHNTPTATPFFRLQAASSTTAGRDQAFIDSAWIDATDATRTGRLILGAYYTTTAREALRFNASSTGITAVMGNDTNWDGLVINENGEDADTRIEGDTDANLVFVDASADMVGIGTASPGSKLDVAGSLQCDSITNDTGLAHGTYTPTLTNVANLAASTAYECQYLRVGNVVTVSGKVDVDPSVATISTQLGISLPVASNIGAAEDCAGAGFANAVAGMGVAILGDATNNRAQMEWIAGNLANNSVYFTFTYQVI